MTTNDTHDDLVAHAESLVYVAATALASVEMARIEARVASRASGVPPEPGVFTVVETARRLYERSLVQLDQTLTAALFHELLKGPKS